MCNILLFLCIILYLNMRTLRILILFSITTLLLLSSCTSRKKTLYFNNSDADSSRVYKSFDQVHKVSYNDVLYINFYSFDKSLSEIFNRQNSTNSYSMWNSEANVYVNGFSVNDSGYIVLPLIGNVYVIDKSIQEVKDDIQNQAKLYIKDITVIVKLLNFRYTVIGEVSRPGTYTNYNNNLTIYQAIASAGDATIFGNKTKSKIIRETKEGQIVIPFDFTDISVLNSDIYYIRPNDIIYIEPVRNKSFRQNLPNIALLFSSITTTILVLNFMSK